MILLGDIVGDDENAVAAAASQVVRIANARSGEGFIAVSSEARKKFWLDRARTAAISKHTNAFKINEDVVIPLDRLGDYSDGIERFNIELSISNKLKLLAALSDFVCGDLPLQQGEVAVAPTELIGDRVERACALLAETRVRWQWLADNLDAPFAALPAGIKRGSARDAAVHDRQGAAGPHPTRVVEDRGARAARGHFQRAAFPEGARAVRRDSQKRVARPPVHRAAHARRRRQRAHQHTGQFGQLRNAAGSEPKRSRASCSSRARSTA